MAVLQLLATATLPAKRAVTMANIKMNYGTGNPAKRKRRALQAQRFRATTPCMGLAVRALKDSTKARLVSGSKIVQRK